MKAHLRKRLEHVEDAIWSTPVPIEDARAAFDRFKATGELPEDERVAATVAQRVKTGRESTGKELTPLDYQQIVRDVLRNGVPPADPYRDALIKEAIWFTGEVRMAARFIVRALTTNGCDFTGPVFTDRKVPEYGTVAWDIIGLPRKFVLPPYEEQAERLFARIDTLRPRLPHGDRAWWRRLNMALGEFPRVLPAEPLVLETVLALTEVEMIRAHWEGWEVGTVMAALDEVAKVAPAERQRALTKLRALAA